MGDEYLPAGQVLPGVELVPLPEGCTPLEAVCLIRALDADGDVGWYTRYTPGLTTVETLGALRTAELLEERRVLSIYEPIDGEE